MPTRIIIDMQSEKAALCRIMYVVYSYVWKKRFNILVVRTLFGRSKIACVAILHCREAVRGWPISTGLNLRQELWKAFVVYHGHNFIKRKE